MRDRNRSTVRAFRGSARFASDLPRAVGGQWNSLKFRWRASADLRRRDAASRYGHQHFADRWDDRRRGPDLQHHRGEARPLGQEFCGRAATRAGADYAKRQQ